MNELARIAYERGALYLAASTPYERELVLEHTALCARRYQQARLQLGGREWLIAVPTGGTSNRCQRCRETVRWVAYTDAKQTLCQACAREDIQHRAPRPAPGAAGEPAAPFEPRARAR